MTAADLAALCTRLREPDVTKTLRCLRMGPPTDNGGNLSDDSRPERSRAAAYGHSSARGACACAQSICTLMHCQVTLKICRLQCKQLELKPIDRIAVEVSRAVPQLTSETDTRLSFRSCLDPDLHRESCPAGCCSAGVTMMPDPQTLYLWGAKRSTAGRAGGVDEVAARTAAAATGTAGRASWQAA